MNTEAIDWERIRSWEFGWIQRSEKVSLKFKIQKTKIMAFRPITSWEIDGETVETVETVSDFIFGGLQNHYRW